MKQSATDLEFFINFVHYCLNVNFLNVFKITVSQYSHTV